ANEHMRLPELDKLAVPRLAARSKTNVALDRMFLICSIAQATCYLRKLCSCWAKRMFHKTSADRTETARVLACFVRSGAKAALVALALTMRMNAPRAEEIDFGPYRAAAEYCAGEFPLRLALSPDRRILC